MFQVTAGCFLQPQLCGRRVSLRSDVWPLWGNIKGCVLFWIAFNLKYQYHIVYMAHGLLFTLIYISNMHAYKREACLQEEKNWLEMICLNVLILFIAWFQALFTFLFCGCNYCTCYTSLLTFCTVVIQNTFLCVCFSNSTMDLSVMKFRMNLCIGLSLWRMYRVFTQNCEK
jgi:hypothetical protein